MGQRRDRESKAAGAARRSARAPKTSPSPFSGLGPRAVPDQEYLDAIRAVNTVEDFIAMQQRRLADALSGSTSPAVAGALIEDIENRLLGKSRDRIEHSGALNLTELSEAELFARAARLLGLKVAPK